MIQVLVVKTGINNIFGKNQIGNFYEPENIFIDINFIDTLPEEELKNGMAEVIKTALVGSKKLWNIISKISLQNLKNKKVLKEIIEICALTKYKIVQDDLEDTKLIRECLNFGHTIGHAIESITGDKHGYCVSIGMCKEILIKYNNKIVTPLFLREQLLNILKNYGLPTDYKDISTKEIINKIKHDKKNNRIVTIKDIGEPFITTILEKDIEEILSKTIKLEKYKPNNNSEILFYDVPPSKSESNRVLLIAALSYEKIFIKNVLISEDTIIMLNALKNLGVRIKILKENNFSIDLIINGCGGDFPIKKCSLYLGNSGTTSRFLIPVLAVQKGDLNYKINCDERMKERPMKDLFKAIELLVGKTIEYSEKDYKLPITITKIRKNVEGLTLNLKEIESSQIISGILFSLSLFDDKNNFIINIGKNPVSMNFVYLTLYILSKFGIEIEINKNMYEDIELKFKNNSNIYFNDYEVGTDMTSISYPIFYSLLNKINLYISNVDINTMQGDIKYCYHLLKKIGYFIEEKDGGLIVFGDANIKYIEFNKLDLDSSDTFLGFCILAAFTPCVTEIYNISNQEKKESKRISIIVDILTKCNINIKRSDDRLIIKGIKNDNELNKEEIIIDTHNDHRIAMCASLLSSKMDNIIINNYTCVNKTYPTFWKDMKRLGLRYKNVKIRKEKRQINFKKNNDIIILIGMPCSGKTTLGKDLSNFLNYKFIDLDEEIKNNLCISNLNEYIYNNGFAKFRQIEYSVLMSIFDKYDEKIVLSCGGGVIENKFSCNLLSRYKNIIFINKNFKDLSSHMNEFRTEYPYKESFEELFNKRYNKYIENSNFNFNILEGESLEDTMKFFRKWIYQLLFKKIIDYESYFLCLGNVNFRENSLKIKEEIEKCDAVEMRADLLDNLNIEYLEEQLNLLQRISIKPVIFTFREEGKSDNKVVNVKEILEMAIRNGCSYVDLELGNKINLDRKYSFIIGSIHASSIDIMNKNLENIHIKKPDILKVVGKSYYYNNLIDTIDKFNMPKIILCDDINGKIFRLKNVVLSPVCSKYFSAMNNSQFTIDESIEIKKLINKGNKKNYYLFGSDISKSPSPYIHNYVFMKNKDKSQYLNFETGDINKILFKLNEVNTGGSSVTMPYKEEIIQYLDYISYDAFNMQAVNTIVKKSNGKLFGYNTDYKAVIDILKLFTTEKLNGLIIGTGGSSLASCYAFNKLDINFDIMGRNEEKMKKMIEKFNGKKIINIQNIKISKKYNVIIICVPPNVKIDYSDLDENVIVIDMRYGLQNVELRRLSKFNNYFNGYEILWRQAYYQYKLWHNKDINIENYHEAMSCYNNL